MAFTKKKYDKEEIKHKKKIDKENNHHEKLHERELDEAISDAKSKCKKKKK